jgi:hypothetical protein
MGKPWIALVAVALLTACSADEGERPVVIERCVTGPGAGIVSLGDVTISGGSSIASGDVFGNGDITISGTSVNVADDAVSASNVTVNGGATIGGFAIESADPITYDPHYADASAAETTNNNAAISSYIIGDQLTLNAGETLSVPAGVYYFDNGIKLTGNCTLTIAGDAQFYVNGTVSVSGYSVIDGTGQLELFSISSDPVNISGDTQATMNIVAPLSDVSLSGGTLFEGSVLGANVDISGGTTFSATGDATDYDGMCSGMPNLPDQPD